MVRRLASCVHPKRRYSRAYSTGPWVELELVDLLNGKPEADVLAEFRVELGSVVAARAAHRPHRLVLLFRYNRRAQVAFQHIPFEGLVIALDEVFEVDGAELLRHLLYHFEDTDLGADGLVFDRLTYCEFVSHKLPFSLCRLVAHG